MPVARRFSFVYLAFDSLVTHMFDLVSSRSHVGLFVHDENSQILVHRSKVSREVLLTPQLHCQ